MGKTYCFWLALGHRIEQHPEGDILQFYLLVQNTAEFLTSANGSTAKFERHYDAFKGFLLALKGHYPSHYAQIKNNATDSITHSDILGRHIKFRNISLTIMSRYL